MTERENIDPDRVHVTGASMGGRGAWDLAYHRAAELASIVPICGFGIPNLAPFVSTIPAWLFHGTEDTVLPEARSAEMATALAAAGGLPRYSALAGQPHDCAMSVYSDPALWRWLLNQRRPVPPETGNS